MKNPKTRRLIAIILISAAVLGWLICLAGLVTIWAVRPGLTRTVVSQVDGTKAILEITTQGLEVTQNSLGAVVASLQVLQGTVQKTADTINSTTPFIDSLISVADENLPKTIEGLKSSLSTAEQGAKVIDDALRKVTNLPIIGNFLAEKGYDPSTPLDKGLADVSAGISRLDDTFTTMSQSLSDTKGNIQDVQAGIAEMAGNIGEIKTNLESARQVLKQYQSLAQSALDFLIEWGDRLPEIIAVLAVLFSVLLLWIAGAQLGLFLQGMGYWEGKERG